MLTDGLGDNDYLHSATHKNDPIPVATQLHSTARATHSKRVKDVRV